MGQSPYDGLIAFSRAWGAVCTVLIKRKGSHDYNKEGSPHGASKKIVDLETAALFMVVTGKAKETDNLFEVRSLVLPYLEAELCRHGLKADNLLKDVKEDSYRRIKKSIDGDMEVLAEYELYGVVGDGKSKTFRLTNLGEHCYEYLTTDNALERSFDDFLGHLNGSRGGHSGGPDPLNDPPSP
jgi:hypothetical protein